MKIILLSIFLTGCATSQWAFRNANDREVTYTEKIDKLRSVSLTERYLYLNIDTNNFSGADSEKSLRRVCIDRIAFSFDEKENVIPIHSSSFLCSDDIDSKISSTLFEDSQGTLSIRAHDFHKIYSSKEKIFDQVDSATFLLRDGQVRKETVKGNKFFYAFVPFTFVVDLVTAPIQLGIFMYEMRKLNLKNKKEKNK